MYRKKSLKISLAHGALLAAVSIALILPGLSEAKDKLTIVSVNTSLILQDYPPFQEAQAEYVKQQQQMQQELSEMEQDQQQTAQQTMMQQLQELGGRLQEEAMAELENDLKKIAQKKGYDYILDESALIFGGKDVTEEIIDALK